MKNGWVVSFGLLVIGIYFFISYMVYLRSRPRSLFKDIPSVPLRDGSYVTYCNLDSAASTLPFIRVCEAIDAFLPYYSNIHRGYGYLSQISSQRFDECRDIVLDFVGADKKEFVCIFGKNTTECMNKLSWCFTYPGCSCSSSRDVILLSEMEHHSNLLPWRRSEKSRIEYIKVLPDGHLDLQDAQKKLSEFQQRISIVSVTGASNVSGIVNPLSTLASMAHQVGAYFCVDGAQLVPHRSVNMTRDHIDFLCFSGHKMYAPFGVGVLIGRKSFFNQHPPCLSGGGEVEFVTKQHVVWKPSPEKEEEGTPNIIGSIALAESIRVLNTLGMEYVEKHEQDLYDYAYQKLSSLPLLLLLSPPPSDRPIGIVTFQVKGIHHQLVGSILSHEYGIGTRTGCFCAMIYIQTVLGISNEDAQKRTEEVETSHDRRQLPGFVRASFSLYTTKDDIDRLYTALERIVHGQYGSYEQQMDGTFVPV